MADAAKAQPRRERPPLDRFLASLAANAKQNAHDMIAGTPDTLGWRDLERAVARFLDADLMIATEHMEAVCHEAERLLLQVDTTGERREGYASTVSGLERHANNGLPTLPVQLVAVRLHETLLWYTAWHLYASNYPTAEVIRVLTSRPGRRPSRALQFPAVPWRQALTVGGNVLHVAGTATVTAANDVASRSMSAIKTFQDTRAERAAQEAEDAKHRQRETEAAESAQRARREAEAKQPRPSPEPDGKDDASATYPAPIMNLDGRRLRGSVIGTWLMLVVLSWVSLVWGALISIPIGVGVGIIATAGVGFIAVPFWGTVWGFLTMNYARDRTLTQMGFKPAPKWSFVVEITDRYSKALGIPMPQVGTIPAFNAFAMGSNVDNATIAIGEPLTTRLTPAELAAVIGHELGHVVSGDMRRMMLMRTFQNATVWFALAQGFKQFVRWIICWAAELAILAFSRRREYWADAIGAGLAGKEAMIGALRKLEDAPPMTGAENTNARFMFRALGSTHPSTAARIRALEQETYIRRLPQQISRG